MVNLVLIHDSGKSLHFAVDPVSVTIETLQTDPADPRHTSPKVGYRQAPFEVRDLLHREECDLGIDYDATLGQKLAIGVRVRDLLGDENLDRAVHLGGGEPYSAVFRHCVEHVVD